MIIKPKLNGNFTQISNELINNENLSLQARFLAIKILSLPDSWQVNSKYLANFLRLSVRRTNQLLKELVDNNIFQKFQECEENSQKFTQNFTIIFKSKEGECQEINERVQALENSELENESADLNGLEESQNEQKPKNKRVESREILPPCGFISHIYNKEFFSNKKFVYHLFQKKVFLMNQAYKVKQEMLNLESFDERERGKIAEWFSYKEHIHHKILNFQSKELQLKKLRGFKLGGQNIISIINRSIENGWQGLFAFQGGKNSERKNSKASVAQEEKNALMAYFDTLNEGKQCLV